MYMYPCTCIEASALIPFTFKDNTFNFCGKNRSHSSKGVNITCSRRFTKLMYLLQILFLELCEHASCGILVALHVRCVWQQLLLCTSQNLSITAQYVYSRVRKTFWNPLVQWTTEVLVLLVQTPILVVLGCRVRSKLQCAIMDMKHKP